MDADLKAQADALFTELGMNLTTAFNTVSYTHLDVYKRQDRCCHHGYVFLILIYFFYRSHPPHKIQFVLHIVIAVF